MESIRDFFHWMDDIVLFKVGANVFTLGSLIIIFVSTIILVYVSGWLKQFLINRVFKKLHMELGVAQSIGTIIKYIVVLIGTIVIIQSNGINLSTLTLLIGGLGIGIGFGLQNIANNLVSGIIILFERPLKVGDRIEIGVTHGKVSKISLLATTILTNDNISIIVPNSEFISSRVINWSHNDDKIRFHVSVQIAYKHDFEEVRLLLLEVAAEDPNVLDDPKPDVRLEEFQNSAIKCTLLVWSSTLMQRQGRLKSNINRAISKKFRENNIEIPFPQMDVKIKPEEK